VIKSIVNEDLEAEKMKKPEIMRRLKIDKDEAVLVVVDYQDRIVPAMNEGKQVIETAAKFIRGCRVLGLPVIVTQQYTKGLGETVPGIKEALGAFEPVEKKSFSAAGSKEFMRRLEGSDRETVIVIGIEAHVCVEQTVLDLIGEGYDVFVITDCISSRHKADMHEACRRMVHSGAVLTTYEAALFEMLGSASEPGFREISAIVK